MRALSKHQRNILEEAHGAEKNKRQADRIKTVLLLHKEYTHQEIADILLLDDSTTRRYEEEYEEGGLDELLADRFTGGTSKLTNGQEHLLETHLIEHLYSTAKEICTWIKDEFTVEYTPHGIVPLLHRLEFSYKKTKQVPGKADPQKQRAFIALYRRIMMYNQYYASYAEFQQAITTFFEKLNAHAYADELQSLLTENFQIIGEQVSQS